MACDCYRIVRPSSTTSPTIVPEAAEHLKPFSRIRSNADAEVQALIVAAVDVMLYPPGYRVHSTGANAHLQAPRDYDQRGKHDLTPITPTSCERPAGKKHTTTLAIDPVMSSSG